MFKRNLQDVAGAGEGLPTTPREAQMRALRATLGVGGAALGVLDPADVGASEASRRLAEKVGLGETGQSLAELVGGAVSGVGGRDVSRAAQLLGDPKTLERLTRDVFDPIARKWRPGSTTAEAAERVRYGPRPIDVEEIEQVSMRGTPVAGTYGISPRRTVQEPGRREIQITTRGMQDWPGARGTSRHEVGGHAVWEEQPVEFLERLTKATETGDLPLNPKMMKSLRYRKLPPALKGNENWAAWQDDFLSGKMEWDAGQLARAPENEEYKRAAKALDWFREQGAIPGQSIPIRETLTEAQLKALRR